MRLTIHQPEFAPWLGFFHKISLADHVLLLDDVQFRKNYFQNRNRIRTDQGPGWITVPVKHSGLGTPINKVEIGSDAKPEWALGLLDKIRQFYKKAPFFSEKFEELKKIFDKNPKFLVDLNIPLIQWMTRALDLKVPFTLSSTLNVTTVGSERILDLCKKMGAATYVSGVSGKDYLDLSSFDQAGIKIEFQEFHHPIYEQMGEGFLPQISSLEAIFLFGSEAGKILKDSWPHKIGTVFT